MWDDDYEEVDLFDDDPHNIPSRVDPDGLTGTDPDRIVRVIVSDDAEVLAVRLTEEWERSVDPRSLSTAVLAALNNAVALAAAVERPQEQTPQPSGDTSELSTEDTIRLVDAVFADLDAFLREVAEVTDRPVHAESRGGHVRGSAQAGQVLELTVDPAWAANRRPTEVESELFEVLRELRGRSLPRRTKPDSKAIAELSALVSDQRTFFKRVGL